MSEDNGTPTSRSMAPCEEARRIVAWADAGRLADDEWLVENNEEAIIEIARALAASAERETKMREALRDAIDDLCWMSGASDFGLGMKAYAGWIKVRLRIERYNAALLNHEAESVSSKASAE